MRSTVEFRSEGETLQAHLYLPESDGAPWPAVVLGGGWCYVKEIAQPTFAETFAARGVAALVFDYRYLGSSTGEPRQHINPWLQIEDYKNAISYVQSRDEVDAARIGVWGISYSGGHVIALAAHEPRVRAMASVVPVVNGYENLRLAHGTMGFRRLLAAVADDRNRRWETGQYGYLPHNPASPDELATWPYPTSSDMFRALKRREGPAYEPRATTVSTEWLLEYDAVPYASRITGTPSLFVLAEGDDHTHWDLALDAYRQIPCPDKSLVVIPRSSHQSLYRDLGHRGLAAEACANWFQEHLCA